MNKILLSKKNIFNVFRLIVGIVAIGIILFYLLKNCNKVTIKYYKYISLSMIIPLFIIPLLGNNRWKYFLSLQNVHENIFYLAKVNFISAFYGVIIPSSQGADAIRILLIEKKYPEKRGKVGSTVLLERLMGSISLGIIASVTVLSSSHLSEIRKLKSIVLIFALIIIIIPLIFFLPFLYNVLNKLIYKHKIKNIYMDKIINYIDKVHHSLILSAKPEVFFKSFILITIIQLTTILNVYLVYRALGIYLPYYIHLTIMPIIYIVSMVPITISGFGVREGMFAYMYGLFGVSAPQAVAASILNYIILALVPTFIGFLIVLITKTKKPEF